MLGWPLALSLLAAALRRTKRAGRTMAVFALALMAVISLATVRNWVVARQSGGTHHRTTTHTTRRSA